MVVSFSFSLGFRLFSNPSLNEIETTFLIYIPAVRKQYKKERPLGDQELFRFYWIMADRIPDSIFHSTALLKPSCVIAGSPFLCFLVNLRSRIHTIGRGNGFKKSPWKRRFLLTFETCVWLDSSWACE